MSKSIIAVRATDDQAAMLKELAKRTGRTQTELLLEGLDRSSELDRVKSENATLRLELQEAQKGKPTSSKEKYPKSARFPLTLQEHDTLRRAAFNQHTTMGMLLREKPQAYLAIPDMPMLEAQ